MIRNEIIRRILEIAFPAFLMAIMWSFGYWCGKRDTLNKLRDRRDK